MTPSEILALALKAERRPPFFSSCFWGFHRTVKAQQLITTGRCVCLDCGAVWMTSLFGDFSETRAEGAAWLRSEAGKLEAAQ